MAAGTLVTKAEQREIRRKAKVLKEHGIPEHKVVSLLHSLNPERSRMTYHRAVKRTA